MDLLDHYVPPRFPAPVARQAPLDTRCSSEKRET
jgi:hypothetical protein